MLLTSVFWSKTDYVIYFCSWTTIFSQLAGHHLYLCQGRARKLNKWKSFDIIDKDTEQYKQRKEPSNEIALTLLRANAIAFLVARNPYERFVSAYRDKILGRCETDDNYRTTNIIVAKYRKNSAQKTATVCPTFKEFVSYVLDEFDAGNDLDPHWTPVHTFCNPCQLKLTHIVKFETFDQDTRVLLQKLNLSHLLPPIGKLKKQNDSQMRRRSPNSASSSLVDSYLNELTPELLRGLRKVYEIDFDLFEYDKKENFQFLKKHETYRVAHVLYAYPKNVTKI